MLAYANIGNAERAGSFYFRLLLKLGHGQLNFQPLSATFFGIMDVKFRYKYTLIDWSTVTCLRT